VDLYTGTLDDPFRELHEQQRRRRETARNLGYQEPPDEDSTVPLACERCWCLVTVGHAERHRAVCGPVE
jgi:hypothetical protein